MKIGIVGDVHFCQFSSIVRGRGNKYSLRIENCINSINWAERVLENCDEVVYLGDFFDTSTLNAEEVSALREIQWNSKPHTFLVGNHEMWSHDLTFNSATYFGGVIDRPVTRDLGEFELCYLPYMVNCENLSHYFGPRTKKRFVFSHNDVKGIQMGPIISPSGIEVSSIDSECDRFINGHLHNGCAFSMSGVNIGNLTGQNFGEDAYNYTHNICILDTDDLSLVPFENPHAFNFYKLTMPTRSFARTLKNNAVITVSAYEEDNEWIKEELENAPNVVTSRVTIIPKKQEGVDVQAALESLNVNHLEKFDVFVKEKLGISETVLDELAKVIK